MSSLISSMVWLTLVAVAGGESASLHGVWAFRLDPSCVGEKESWHKQVLPDRIALPGTTDEAGYGEKTNGIEGGYLSRVHKYIGPAWYQREIEIPQSWRDQEVELFLERVLWESKAWIDERFCDSQDSLGTPHLHRLGRLAPGKHRLTLRVNNAMIHPIGDISHCYTEQMQTIWNGVVGRIELRAHPPVWIKQQQVFPNDGGMVRINATLGNEFSHPAGGDVSSTIIDSGTGRVVGTGKTGFNIPRGLREDGSHVVYRDYPIEIVIKLSETPNSWSEFNPALYRVESQLLANAGTARFSHTAAATFGFRTVGRSGKHIAINGRPTFVRGSLDCVHFPLTGYPPCDVEAWRRLFRIYKEYGLNQVRFHSWCPPEAAFQAADELGIYIQAEVLWIDAYMAALHPKKDFPDFPGLPQGVGKNDRTIDQYVRAEMRRIFDAYGNHPSFTFFVIGNELGNSNFEVMAKWIGEEKARDPRRLYAASTARTITPADDFSDTHVIPNVGQVVNRLGVPNTDWDYEASYSRAPVPIIAHEMGQMPVYPCWDEIAKYTGVLRARRLEHFRQQARNNGIETQSRELQLASGASNRIVYKNEMEAQLRSPSCSGVSWLGMQDFSGQNEALVGWLDSFYDSKGIIAPSQFRRYSSTTVPLARFKKYVWTNGEKFRALAELAHWGPHPLVRTVAVWRLRDAQDTTIASGEFPPSDFPVGSVTVLGPIEVDLNSIGPASRLNLDIALRGTEFANDWNLWVFPQQTTVTTPANVVVCDRTEAALKALTHGQRVLLLAHRLGAKNNTRYAAWMPLFWSAILFPGQNSETLAALVQNRHPALAGFPTDAHLDWQWHDICNGARGFVLDDLPPDFRPIVQPVSDFHFNHKLGGLFEFRTKEAGKLLVCGYNLADNLANRPAARQLRKSLLDYAASPAFEPKQEITAEHLVKLLSARTPGSIGAGVKGDSPIIADAKIGTVPKAPLTKLPVNFGSAMENTPVVFGGRPLLVINHRDDAKQNTDEYLKTMYLYIQDLSTGQEVARFGEGYTFVSAFVNGPELHVFASESTKSSWTKSIYHFWSTDLKTWKRELAIPIDGDEHLFNSSVCTDAQGYLMAYESNKPVQFCFKFARSKDLFHWEKIPGLTFTGEKNEYSACPVIRYFAPYHYVIYLHAAIPKHKGWVSFLARSKDLAAWELSPLNPILEASEGEGINNSDVDLFEWEGNTYLFYATGDQQTWGSVRVAMYPGPMKGFFEACFPAGVQGPKANAQTNTETKAQRDRRMAWWRQARFGMFIHWGIMSIPGQDSVHKNKDLLSGAEYEKLVSQYNPVKWDAREVVKLAKEAGQKYIVLVAKHHDGFAMWDTKLSDFNVMRSPYGKDVVRQLADECARQGVVFCFYYSILDWHHPDANPQGWPKYVEYMKGQLRELLTNYGPVGVVWFDGDWIPQWTDLQGRELAEFIRSIQPQTIINNRIGKGRKDMAGMTKAGHFAADFGTPEQVIPSSGLPGVDWESCMTINGSWSWNKSDLRHKSTAKCIEMLVDTASKGGNLLLDIGPHPDGSILPEQQDRLRGIGRWMRVNHEAIYGTQASPFARQLSWGRCTRRLLADGNTRLYLHVFDWPKDGKLVVPGLSNPTAAAAYLLADPHRAPLEHETGQEQVTITLPAAPPPDFCPVVVLDVRGQP